MSATAFAVEEAPASLPFETLVETLIALGVSFRRKGEDMALTNAALLTADLRQAVADNKGALLALADLHAALARLFDYEVRLRCADPPKGTRSQALAYQAQQIEKLAALSVSTGGSTEGWPDPSDPFAYGDQITGLRVNLADLTREDAPYPLGPLADDPFTADPPRYYSGKVIGLCLSPGHPQYLADVSRRG